MNDMTEGRELMTVAEPRRQAKALAAVPPKAGGHVEPFVPKSIEEIKWVVGLLIESGLAPDSFKGDPKKITVAVLKGLEIGLPPMMAVSNIAVINGRASIWGDAALALVQSRNVIERMEVEEVGATPEADADTAKFSPDYGFIVRIWRRGQTAPYVGKFTVGDAKRARLWMNVKKTPWIEHPKRMLKIRATAFPLRDGFADCLSGLSIREEVEDLPPAIEKTDTSFLDDEATEPASAVVPPAERQEAGGDAQPASPPADPFPLYDAEGGLPFTMPTADAFLKALLTAVEGTAGRGENPLPFWEANKEGRGMILGAGDKALAERLAAIQGMAYEAAKAAG